VHASKGTSAPSVTVKRTHRKAGSKGFGAFTLKRDELEKEDLRIRALECAQWIGKTTDHQPFTNLKTTEPFFTSIQDGVLLCKLIERITRDVPIRYRADAKAGTFQSRDNITQFLTAAKSLGVSDVSLFEANDLVSRKNDKNVVGTLLRLSKIGAVRYHIEPPAMVKFELEFEEEEKRKKEEKEKAATAPAAKTDSAVKEEDEDDDDDTASKSPPQKAASDSDKKAAAVPPVSLQSSTATDSAKKTVEPTPTAAVSVVSTSATETAKDAPAAKAAPTPTVGAKASVDAVPQGAPVPTPTPPTAAMQKKEKHRKEKVGMKTESLSKDGRAALTIQRVYRGHRVRKEGAAKQSQYLPYVPKKSDDVDQAVAKAVNGHSLDIEIRSVAIKKKKRAHSAKAKHKAEYMIGGQRVHVRIIQGVLMAHQGGEWVNFVRFVQERMGFQE